MAVLKNPIRIVLVDDHHLVRRGIAALLQLEPDQYQVVAEASDGAEILEKIDEISVDVIILDLSMPRLNGIETARRLSRKNRFKIIILSMYSDPEFVSQAFEAGASGYVLKESIEDELFTALNAVYQEQDFVSPSIKMPEKLDQIELTSREREIIQLIAEGHNTTEISDLLSISPHTASRHRANVMAKLNTHTQAGLVRVAIERRLIILNQRP